MPGRELLDVVGDQHRRRRVGVGGEPGQAAQEVLAAAEVHAGGGLVEQQQLGVGHQRAGDLHPLALALAQRAVGALGQADRRRSGPSSAAARRTSSRP